MNLINKQKKANPIGLKTLQILTYFFLVVKLSIFELKQLFTLTFSHDAKKYVLKLRTQLVFLRKRRHCLVPENAENADIVLSQSFWGSPGEKKGSRRHI